ncbi:hypothetical protein ACVIQT_002098 [Bradyrhizobium diazoefficiens]
MNMPVEKGHAEGRLDLWPPDPRVKRDDQKRLEHLLNQRLDEHWRDIFEREGLSLNAQQMQDERDAKPEALKAAQLGYIKPLQHLVEMAIGPDGKPLGKEISEKYVRRAPRQGEAKYKRDSWYEAMQNPYKKKLTEAVWEASRVRDILLLQYGHTPRGYDTRTDLKVAAERGGIVLQELRDWKANRNCPTDPWPIDRSQFLRQRDKGVNWANQA